MQRSPNATSARGYAPAVWLAACSLITTASTALCQCPRPLSLLRTDTGVSAGPLTSADLDGDHVTDLIVARSNGLAVWKGRDDTYDARPAIDLGGTPRSIATYRTKGTHAVRIAATLSSGSVVLLTTNVDLTLEVLAKRSVGGAPTGLATADLDGDGDLDLIVADAASDSIVVVTNKGETDYDGVERYGFDALSRPIPGLGRMPFGIEAFAVGDVDGDGATDVVTWSSRFAEVAILRNRGSGTFDAPDPYPVGIGGASSVALGDFNRDGRLDIAAVAPRANLMAIAVGLGGGKFQPGPVVIAGSEPSDLIVADLDRDGALDIASSNTGSHDVSIAYGDGEGQFQVAPYAIPVTLAPTEIHISRDSTSSIDTLIVASRTTGAVSLLRRSCDRSPWIHAPNTGIAGAHGKPVLFGDGEAKVDAPFRITLANAPSGAPAALILGRSKLDLPLAGGVLHPFPTAAITLPLGFPRTELRGRWTDSIYQAEVLLSMQLWVFDPTAPQGLAASDGLTVCFD